MDKIMDALGPKTSLVDQTYHAMLDAICTGQLKPGTRLSQDQLAAELGVSRQPVNSAIAMLKTQRFVEDTGRRGVVVSPIDPDLLQSVYQFRSAVDPLAVRLAGLALTEQASARAKAIINAGRSAVESGDAVAAIKVDMDFHNLIYELSGNALIQDAMQLNWRHLQRAMGEVLAKPGMTEAVWREHATILSLMQAGDLDGAAEAAHAHVVEAAARIARPG
ncbi:MAG: DNA-binding GntR family transcriptional regulator [Sulfitobacter sp.]|jgi:DNA-binding GntR family transcriptional regulator